MSPVSGKETMSLLPKELYDYLDLFYIDQNIPMYVFSGEELLASFPQGMELPAPPKMYVDQLQKEDFHISLVLTEYGTSYGGIQLMELENTTLVLGPVSFIPYTMSDLHQLYKDYMTPMDRRSDVRLALETIPSMTANSFLHKLVFLHYGLNRERIPFEEFRERYLGRQDVSAERTVNPIGAKKSGSILPDFQKHNESYKIENQISNMIRAGNVEGIKGLTVNDTKYNYGVLAPNAVRQLRDMIIVTTTVSTRAAIDGGLDYDTAYHMSDHFIQQAEALTRPDELTALMGQISYQFALKVRESRVPVTSNDILEQAIQYILQHVDDHISVSDVADSVGFSRSYFTTYFKKEMGFSISEFILRSKLEEARKLLQYSDRSLAEISSYLCFSSQSHFQTTFKKQYGITPQQYRKKPELIRKEHEGSDIKF